MTITALAGSILLLGITSSLSMTREAMDRTIALGMAQQLMDEVIGNRYAAVGAGGHQTTLGPSLWEQQGPGRSRYDDIDDYHGLMVQPPADLWGIELGTDDGAADQRHPDFQAPAGHFDDWRQEVEVYYVAASDLTTRLPPFQTSDYRAVEVRIVYEDPEHGERELARLRRVVAYVPPL